MDPNPNPPSVEGRNWAELSPDVLSVIFGKIGAVEILMGAGRVCRGWRRVAREPLLWRRVDMTHLDHLGEAEMEAMARLAVDWSAGRMEEFSAARFGSDELLLYIAERANLLKSLCLVSCYDISDEGLTEMVKRFPCLEKLEIIFGSFTMKLCESVGQACPQLKLFKLNTKGSYYMSDDEEELDNTDDCDALGIAKTMHELRQLQLFGNKVTNEGLKAILDSCPHLESLDIRRWSPTPAPAAACRLFARLLHET
ncbi:F-box protein SKIP19, partial [Ananas comosus]